MTRIQQDLPNFWKTINVIQITFTHFYMKTIGLFISQTQYQTAGDVTRVSVVPRKVTVKIGDAENWWLECRDKRRLKKANIHVRLVLSRVSFKSGV